MPQMEQFVLNILELVLVKCTAAWPYMCHLGVSKVLKTYMYGLVTRPHIPSLSLKIDSARVVGNAHVEIPVRSRQVRFPVSHEPTNILLTFPKPFAGHRDCHQMYAEDEAACGRLCWCTRLRAAACQRARGRFAVFRTVNQNVTSPTLIYVFSHPAIHIRLDTDSTAPKLYGGVWRVRLHCRAHELGGPDI